MIGRRDNRPQGAFLCSISPEDFEISIKLGIYGNRYEKSKSGKDLKDNSKLSIIRDLIAIKPGDLIFLHVIDEQKIYGVFEASSKPFYSEQSIWHSQEEELFPCRFCFKAYRPFENMIRKGKIPYITVSNLYEIIETEGIKSLISVEFERNVERRGVRKILFKDAIKIIKNFLCNHEIEVRDIECEDQSKCDLEESENSLKDIIFKVGDIENAVKAVLLYELAWKGNFFNVLFGEQRYNIISYDFVNEVFISPIVRKLIDIYICAKLNNGIEKHFVVEVKTGKVQLKDLFQGIRYADLLLTLGWISSRDYEREVIMVGRSFDNSVKEYAARLNTLYRGKSLRIRLISYKPSSDKKWASFKEEVLKKNGFTLFKSIKREV